MSKTEKTVVLLDLNYTLAVKTGLNVSNWTYDVKKDVYSKPLVAALNKPEYEIHLLTARPVEYEKETLAKIVKDTGMVIDVPAFKPDAYRFKKVHEYKGIYLQELLDSGVKLENIIAIESNQETRKVYKSLGLTAVTTRDGFLTKN